MIAINSALVLSPADYAATDFAWGRLTWFVSGPQGSARALTVGRCEIRPGCENPRHLHPNCEEVLHVLQGEISHRIEGGEEVVMRAGDTISIPPHLKHNAHNLGASDAVMLICFSSAERQIQGE